MKTLYLECGNGAAGDMICASLWELIDNKEEFIEKINNAGIPGAEVFAVPSVKCGINGTHFKVLINGTEEEPGHVALPIDDSHAHVEEHMHGHNHMHEHMGEHTHEHHEHHEHAHTSLSEIEEIINSLNVSNKVKTDAINIYKLIAEAESTVHGVSVVDIHFHEVGTMDAIVDVVSASLLMETLSPDSVIASAVNTGKGSIKCSHGILSIPAPATALLLKGIPIYSTSINGELCTPTGAALLKYFVNDFGPMPVMNIQNIGYGMGTKDYESANYLRAILGIAEKDPSVLYEKVPSASKHSHPVYYSAEQTKVITNRLSRSIGHLQSVKRMVEDNRDASDVLVQLAAVESSIGSTARVIIKEHFKHSVDNAVKNNSDVDFDNLYGIIDKFLK